MYCSDILLGTISSGLAVYITSTTYLTVTSTPCPSTVPKRIIIIVSCIGGLLTLVVVLVVLVCIIVIVKGRKCGNADINA